MSTYFSNSPKKNNLRLIIIFIGICILFALLLIQLYRLQIISGDFLKNQVLGTISKPITLDAPRGNIYDRYGRPLAVNESSFTVNIDPSIPTDNINDIILDVVNILEENNEQIIDEFPISKTKPYEFLFGNSPSLERTWKNDMELDQDISANDAFYELRADSYFGISPNLSDEDARKILSVKSELYKKRFSKFLPITLAYDVSQKTISAITENSSEYPNIFIDVEAKRKYPGGEPFSHILGYIRGINSTELENFKKGGHTQYTLNDIIGKEGLEKSFELSLKGIDGVAYYAVDNVGRKIAQNKENYIAPIPGNDVFLTVDSNLTEITYNAIETTLRDTIINRLLGKNKNKVNLSSKEIYSAMIKANTLNISLVLNSKDKTYSHILKSFILSKDKEAINDIEKAKNILSKGIENGSVSQRNVVMSLFEQGVFTGDDKYKARVRSSNISPKQVLIDKLNSLELTPHMTGLLEAPASASVMVTDITNGDVLASVSYPSYDNNRFVNNFDNDYYHKLNTDPTTPMINRPFTEPRAPGSIFKMITAIAGLETGLITPNTYVYDKDVFTKAGRPYAECWIHGSHGNVDVEESLEVSCNYFYYELSYNMGIDILNKYMKEFGLNERSGVEIYELYDSSSLSKYPSKISSPEYKKYIESLRNPDASSYDLNWTAGDTIRTAIGQSYNNYTAAILTKAISTIANGGDRYSLHFLDKIKNSSGNTVKEQESILEHTVKMSEATIKEVHTGMYRVTTGNKGTLRNSFKDFPVKIAAKSGTAQEVLSGSDHTVFTGFAPYDDPQIAITVFIPYGDDTTSPAPKITKIILEEYLSLNKTPEKAYTNSLTQ